MAARLWVGLLAGISVNSRDSISRIARAGATYFGLVFGAGFLLGLVRIPLVEPRFGERVAGLFEAPVMLVVIFFASRHIVRRFSLAAAPRTSVTVGLLSLALLLVAELLFAVVIAGGSVIAYISARDPVSGTVYAAALLLYAAMPWLQTRPATMHTHQRLAFDREIALAKALMTSGDLARAQGHLERAHVIGQMKVAAHAKTHWLMLKLELRRGRLGAAFGQVIRLKLGVIGSAVGVVPVGNTGGSDVGMFRRMPIPPELQDIIDGRSSGQGEA